MITIIPIFIEDNNSFWRTSEGNTLIQKGIVSALNAQQTENTIIFTNDDVVLGLAKSLGTDAILIKGIDLHDSELFPTGTRTSLNYLRDVLRIDLASMMILGFRNPLLTPDLIDEAIRRFKNENAPALISVRLSTDHPCQLNAYYNIEELGIIHLFDNDGSIVQYLQLLDGYISGEIFSGHAGECFKLTHPFYFDWESRGIYKKGNPELYVRYNDGFKIRYLRIQDVPNNNLSKISLPIWLYESNQSARILLNLENYFFSKYLLNSNPDLNLIGAAFFAKKLSAVLLKDRESKKHFLNFNFEGCTQGSYMLKAVSTNVPNKTMHHFVDIEIDKKPKLIQIEFGGKDTYTIIYSLLRIAHENTYDLHEPFTPINKLWFNDNNTGKLVNTESGKQITGRQEFPDVFEPDGSFLIVTQNSINSLDRDVFSGEAIGYVLEANQSVQVDSTVDLIRYKAVNKANQQG